jgi:transcriptional antiterminator RfaH
VKIEREDTSSPLAELWADRRRPAWFCLRTHLKHEHIAAAHLRRIPGVEIFNPQLRLLRTTRQGRRWSIESVFPNYIFARFILESLFEKVGYTPGVKFVLRFGDQVPAIPDAVIENLREEMTELESQTITDTPVEGEQIEITHGAFAGTKAVVAQVLPGQQRARILIDVMGRSVPAELSLGLVLVNRRNAAEIALKKAAETAVKQTAMPVTLAPLPIPLEGTGERATRVC